MMLIMPTAIVTPMLSMSSMSIPLPPALFIQHHIIIHTPAIPTQIISIIANVIQCRPPGIVIHVPFAFELGSHPISGVSGDSIVTMAFIIVHLAAVAGHGHEGLLFFVS
mmetsp:Transcript_31597/g.61394  ORF Transcript_31597/g.61394 Transcript_31597/m.61394 type:complete len:109 (+) Transcript_31597:75-401(+)